MENTIYYLIGLVIVLLIVVIVVLFRSNNSSLKKYIDRELSRNQQELRQMSINSMHEINEIRASMSNDMMSFNHHISEDFSSLSERTVYKLSQLEKNLNNNIQSAYKLNSETFANIQERLTRIDSAQKNIEELSKDISSLENVLLDKKNRGTFGEIELYSLLENALGINDALWQKQYHFNNGYIADAVIFGNSAMKSICIDSKFPLENYRRMFEENISNDDKTKYAKAFRNDVIKHINDIADKYIIDNETAEFAYMFIPAEAIFAYINAEYTDVIEYSYRKKVYLVSPATLMAYLTAIRSIYLGQKRDEKAAIILKELAVLAEDFRRFKERSEKMLKASQDFMTNFEQFEISVDKIARKFDKINGGDDIHEDKK